MQSIEPDIVEVQSFQAQERSLLFRCTGHDRAGLVAQATGLLENQNLYVDSISFNLVLPRQDRYEMEVLAKGAVEDLRTIYDRIQAKQFLASVSPAGRVSVYWPTAFMFHIALNTPDREGIIAQISDIVGQHRDIDSPYQNGSFVHLIGMTHNSSGPEGGTAYFSVRANVASQSLKVQKAIESHLLDWAQEWNIEADLWMQDLNRP